MSNDGNDPTHLNDDQASGERTPDQVSQMRREYCRDGLRRIDLAPDPIAQFDRWFREARESGIIESNAMSLATAGPDGQTSLRTVLMKGFDKRGFVFYTNLESGKARQIQSNPQVSLLFPWLLLERQVIVNGFAEALPQEGALAYFHSRPRGSQLAAWASPQSHTLDSRDLLESRLQEVKRKFGEGPIPLPPFWGGYLVVARTVEYWQGRPNRLHDRFRYTRIGEAADSPWRIDRLAP